MDQGCINEGKDRRLCGKIVCFLQRLFSFKSNFTPFTLVLETIGFRLILPWFAGKRFMIRLHLFRYDFYAKEYIFFSAAVKRIAATDEAL